MKRKPVKPFLSNSDKAKLSDLPIDKKQIEEALKPSKRTVGDYKPNEGVEIIGNDLANQIKGENLVKSRTSEQSQSNLVSDLRKDISAKSTTIAQLKESIDIKDSEINIYKEQQGILETELIDAKNKRELFAKNLGAAETELLSVRKERDVFKEACVNFETRNAEFYEKNRKLEDYNLQLGAELNSIKQKWYYRWFS